MKRWAFLSAAALLAVTAAAQSIEVYDGPTLGVDIDTQSSTAEYRGSWSASGIDWPPAPAPNRYSYELVWETGEIPVTVFWGQVPEDSVPGYSENEVQVTIPGAACSPPLQAGAVYRLKVTAWEWEEIIVATGISDGVLITTGTGDTTPPSVSLPLAAIQTATTFTVSWTATDADSGVARYDVDYRIGAGAWQRWLTGATRTSQTFSGSNGQTYGFRVTAWDRAGNSASAEATTVINAMGPSLSITASPSILSFAAGETSRTVTLTLTASGGSVNINTLRETRTYTTAWGTEEGPQRSVSVPLAAGASATLDHQILLDDIARAKALGAASTGSFTVVLTASGNSSQGQPVSAAVTFTASVTGGLASTLNIMDVEIQLPPSPYNPGDQIQQPLIHITGTGTGLVSGEVRVDGSTGWSANPRFVVNVPGIATFPIEGLLPTDTPGTHTVQVEIYSPDSITRSAVYEVSNQPSPFPPQRLTLVPGVAELFELNGTAEATRNDAQGYEEYTFTGKARMRFLSLGNAETDADALSVEGLVVRFPLGNPASYVVRAGTVSNDLVTDGPLANNITFAKGLLKVRAVHFEGNAETPTDHLLIDADFPGNLLAQIGSADLPAPFSMIDDFLNGLILRADGVEGKSFSFTEADDMSFEAFGVRFALQDVDANARALVLGRDAATDRWYVSISGVISWGERSGGSTSQRQLTNFRNLAIYSDGTFVAGVDFSPPFAVVPDYLMLNRLRFEVDNGVFGMKIAGELRNLPYPFDGLGAIPFEIAFDTEGNASGDIAPIAELRPGGEGHGIGSDATEWDLGIATVDITHLALHLAFAGGSFDRDHSEVRVGADFYLDGLQNNDGSQAEANARRVTFGELDAQGVFQGGVRVTMGGDFTWSAPSSAVLLTDKVLDLEALVVYVDELAISGSPLALVLTGGIQIGISEVEGRVNFEGLSIGLDGSGLSIENFVGGHLKVMDIVFIGVEEVSWSDSPTTLTFEADATTGSGNDRQFAKAEQSIQVESYFRLLGAVVNIGSQDDPIMSGGFEELTVYKPVGQGRSFVLRRARVAACGAEIMADVAYQPALLRVAGSVSLPSGISAIAVGKIGKQNNKPTMGVFVAVAGLTVPVGPGVMISEIGGGFFINPVEEDLQLVRMLARFERPELDDEITNRRPGGATNPGSFAVMVLGGVKVGAESLVSGRALVTITANYFNLDAEVEVGSGLLEGKAYLAIGWDPAFAEGAFTVNVDIVKIISATGRLEFYVYSSDLWGVTGYINVAILGEGIATGSLFVGPPGFMMDMKVSIGADLGIVSGEIGVEGMVWYYAAIDPDSLGIYAAVWLRGEILWGLLSASAKLEGALIVMPKFILYAVGSFKFKICWITVFNGSLWVAIGSDGIDGGKGRNEEYDKIIEDARHMADAMQQSRDELQAALEAAELALYQLDEAQREAAGLALVERSGLLGFLAAASYAAFELNHYESGLPPVLAAANQTLFGPEAQALYQMRTELANARGAIDTRLQSLSALHDQVTARLADIQPLLVEPLPSVADLASGENPFKGFEERTVQIGGRTKRVKSGFGFDGGAAVARKAAFASAREAFANYQTEFIERAGIIDANLRELDRVLYQDQQSLSRLNERYADVYSRFGAYLEQYVRYQEQNGRYASQALSALGNLAYSRVIDGVPRLFLGEDAIRELMTQINYGLSYQRQSEWNRDRVSLINALIAMGRAQGAEIDDYTPQSNSDLLFRESGVEIWFAIPRSGFTAAAQLAPQRKEQALAAHRDSVEPFRASWARATGSAAMVYERKAALYELLHEIYDQLAVYGTGTLPVDGAGNASGSSGMQATGLSLRSTSAAAGILSQAAPIASGTLAAGGLEVSTGTGGITGQVGTLSGVSVRVYFAAKRAEIAPYLQVPQLTTVSGGYASSGPDIGRLAASFAATHPVGVAEAAWRVEAALAGTIVDTTVEVQTSGVYGMSPSGPQSAEGAPQVPWYSVGTRQELLELFLSRNDQPGNRALLLRVRGAGGYTIVRRLRFPVSYAAEGGSVSQMLDAGDTTPPTVPLVLLASTVTGEAEQITARWSASDFESGVQRYEYGVATIEAPPPAGSNEVSMGALPMETSGIAGLTGLATTLDVFAQAGTAAGAATPQPDVLGWTDAGGRTEVNIRPLALAHAGRYAVLVRVTNGAGLQSVGISQPLLVDLTGPAELAIEQLEQITADGHPNSLRFRVRLASDAQSGVVSHELALGSQASLADLVDWTEVTATTGTVADVPVTAGTPVFFTLRATNGVGRQSVASRSVTLFYPGAGPPPPPVVATEPAGISADRSALTIGWNEVSDGVSGIVGYEYGIGSTPESPDVLPWTRVARTARPYLVEDASGIVVGAAGWMEVVQTGVVGQTATAAAGAAAQASAAAVAQAGPQLLTDYRVPLTGLGLTQGGRYFALVRATNGAGLTSVGASEPVLVDQTEPQAAIEAVAGQVGMLALKVRLTAQDAESGLAAVRWDVWQTAAAGAPWRAGEWMQPQGDLQTTAPIAMDFDIAPAGLQPNSPYAVRLQVRNRAGLVATTNVASVMAIGVTQQQWIDVMQSGGRRILLLREVLEAAAPDVGTVRPSATVPAR